MGSDGKSPAPIAAAALFAAVIICVQLRKKSTKRDLSKTEQLQTEITENQQSRGLAAALPPQEIDTAPLPLPLKSRTSTSGSSTGFGETEVLLHNVSHTDVVFSVNSADFNLPDDAVLGRPKFSCFRKIHLKIWDAVQLERDKALISYKQLFEHKDSELQPVLNNGEHVSVPAGFDLKQCNIRERDLDMLKLRGSDTKKLMEFSRSTAPYVCAVQSIYFPLLAILVPSWLKKIEDKIPTIRIIYLITGQGTPRDSRADVMDNSTEFTAKLMELFLRRIYPDIIVVLLHSGRHSNLFRYDDNIKFVKSDLMPSIEGYRDLVVSERKDKWKDYFKVTVSFADGSSARVSAINAALRPYR
jgi:hypothetical protein